MSVTETNHTLIMRHLSKINNYVKFNFNTILTLIFSETSSLKMARVTSIYTVDPRIQIHTHARTHTYLHKHITHTYTQKHIHMYIIYSTNIDFFMSF